MYRVLGKSEATLAALGASVASATHDAILYGQAEITPHAILNENLSLRRDRLPRLHVDIVGWPDGDEQASKSARMLIAEHFANVATLHSAR